jgi:hypothetical protein
LYDLPFYVKEKSPIKVPSNPPPSNNNIDFNSLIHDFWTTFMSGTESPAIGQSIVTLGKMNPHD